VDPLYSQTEYAIIGLLSCQFHGGYYTDVVESAYRVADIKRLLIVEDDSVTRNLLTQVLEQAGYQVTAVRDGSEALSTLQQQGLPHLIILDLGLPGMHGFQLSERIKRMGDVPIVILTGDSSEDHRIEGILQYAEDYITKPFNVREVAARIQRILSRMPDYSYAQEPLTQVDEHLAIDFANNRIIVDGNEIVLTPTETSLLSVLVRNRGRFVPLATLISRVWPNEEVYEETLRVHIARLRSKLQRGSNQAQYILTERGVGYAFYFPEDHDVH
jgi:DNA-binding response OmpR family regulator